MSSGPQLKATTGHGEKLNSPAPIIEELQRVLNSDEFSATPKRREMLRFLVEETLAGRPGTLKGYVIGLNVFGRDDDFDPQSDPIVRLEARRLRHDLDSYYVAAGAKNPIRISIPKGQYVPRFHSQFDEPEPGEPPAAAPRSGEEPLPQPPLDPQPAPAARSGRFPWKVALTAGLIVLSLIGVASVIRYGAPVRDTVKIAKPSVMVLPFEVSTSNGEQELLAAGIADRIMTALSRFPDFHIFLPPNRTQGGEPIDAIAIGSSRGSAFLIAGSVRSKNDVVRVNAKLIQTESKKVLWSNTYDRVQSRNSLLEIEQNIAREIASIVGEPYGVIKTAMTAELPDISEPGDDSFECVLRGYIYRRDFRFDLYQDLQTCLMKTVEQDPSYAEAWAMLGWVLLDAGRFGYGKAGSEELYYDRALGAASHALTLDGGNVLALKATSSINHYMGNIEEGERFARKAYDLNPYDPDTLAQLGWRLAIVGNFKEGLPLLEAAIDRTTNTPGWYFHMIAISHLLHGQYAEMLTAAKKGILDNGSGTGWPLVAIAQSELGNKEAARAALANMAERIPKLNRDPAAVLKRAQATDEIIEAIVTSLKKAGWEPPPAN